jgi:hypothetical protein
MPDPDQSLSTEAEESMVPEEAQDKGEGEAEAQQVGRLRRGRAVLPMLGHFVVRR